MPPHPWQQYCFSHERNYQACLPVDLVTIFQFFYFKFQIQHFSSECKVSSLNKQNIVFSLKQASGTPAHKFYDSIFLSAPERPRINIMFLVKFVKGRVDHIRYFPKTVSVLDLLTKIFPAAQVYFRVTNIWCSQYIIYFIHVKNWSFFLVND